MSLHERRSSRSQTRETAMRLYLEHMTQRSGHDAVAVADECGRLMVGAGAEIEAAWIAAAAPHAHSRGVDGLLDDLLGDRPLRIWHVQSPLTDDGCYLASLGGDRRSALRDLRAVHRILFAQ